MGNKILGTYNYREGGSIYININDNMKYNTPVNTQIHEMNHMHLDNATTLGNVLKMLEMERCCTPSIDQNHVLLIEKYQQIIRSNTSVIQEIYANGIELLLLQHLGNENIKETAYQQKTDDYKHYCDVLKFIVDDKKKEYIEKHRNINLLCFYALAVENCFVEFIFEIKDEGWDLNKYFQKTRCNPNSRLEYALNSMRENDVNELLACISEQNVGEIVEALYTVGILKYSENVLKELKAIGDYIGDGYINEEQANYWMENYQRQIEERIKVFDFEFLRRFENKIENYTQLKNKNVCILNLGNEENNKNKLNVYIHECGEYECYQGGIEAVNACIGDFNCICIPSADFSFIDRCPKYFKANRKLFVLFENYSECNYWIKKYVINGDFYIGDLYDSEVNNFFSILVFADRLQSGIIYLFPTTKRLAQRIVEENKLSDRITYSNERAFFTVIAGLGTKADMLKDIQWIFAFITGSKGTYNPKEDSAAQLSYDLVVNLLNSSFDLLEKDNYYLKYILPTERTIGKPFFIPMLFEKGYNTGKIYTCDERYIVLFPNKNIGKQWMLKHCRNTEEKEIPTVVGVDKLYWRELGPRLRNVDRKIILCLDVLPTKDLDVYKEFSLQQLNEIIMK